MDEVVTYTQHRRISSSTWIHSLSLCPTSALSWASCPFSGRVWGVSRCKYHASAILHTHASPRTSTLDGTEPPFLTPSFPVSATRDLARHLRTNSKLASSMASSPSSDHSPQSLSHHTVPLPGRSPRLHPELPWTSVRDICPPSTMSRHKALKTNFHLNKSNAFIVMLQARKLQLGGLAKLLEVTCWPAGAGGSFGTHKSLIPTLSSSSTRHCLLSPYSNQARTSGSAWVICDHRHSTYRRV